MAALAMVAFSACLVGGWWLPWWWPALVGAVLGFSVPRVRYGVWAAAGGAALAWGAAALWINTKNHGLLAGKVADLFHVSGGGWMVVGTILLGGATAGLGAWMGAGLRRSR